mgnify:CR=1 FL=1
MKKKTKIKRINCENLKGPYLVLSSHASFIDFPHNVLAMENEKSCWVASVEEFIGIRSWLFDKAKVIPKRKFSNDMVLIRKIGDKDQKIVVMGNADCISNGEFSKSRNGVRAANYNLVLETGRWFSNGEYPVNTYRPDNPDTDVYLRYKQVRYLKAVLIGVIPALIGIIGLIVWLRRRKE